jgi:hypothetical protein
MSGSFASLENSAGKDFTGYFGHSEETRIKREITYGLRQSLRFS